MATHRRVPSAAIAEGLSRGIRPSIVRSLNLITALSLILSLAVTSAPRGEAAFQGQDTETPTETPSATPVPSATLEPPVTATATETPAPPETDTPEPSATATTAQTPTSTDTPPPAPSPTETASVSPTASPSPTSEQPFPFSISLSASPPSVNRSEALILHWDISSTDPTGKTKVPDGSHVEFSYPPGFHLAQEDKQLARNGQLNVAISRLRLPAEGKRGEVHWTVEAEAAGPFIISATLVSEDKIIATASLSIEDHRFTLIPIGGGNAADETGRVRVSFPGQTVENPMRVWVRSPQGSSVPPFSLSGQPFEILAEEDAPKSPQGDTPQDSVQPQLFPATQEPESPSATPAQPSQEPPQASATPEEEGSPTLEMPTATVTPAPEPTATPGPLSEKQIESDPQSYC
jgi:hypothetical protein